VDPDRTAWSSTQLIQDIDGGKLLSKSYGTKIVDINMTTIPNQ